MSDKLRDQIILAYTSTDQIVRKNAEQYLQQLEETDNQLCFQLLITYDQYQEIKFYTIILIKHIIKRRWISFAGGERHNFLTQEIKTQIQERILQLYCQEENARLKLEIQNIILDICAFDYPGKFQVLLQLINQWLEQKPLDFNFLQLQAYIYKKMQKNQSMNQQYYLLFGKIGQLWLSSEIDDPQIDLLLDKLFLSFVLAYNHKTFNNQIDNIFVKIIQKVAKLLNKSTITLYQKNIAYLVKRLSQIIQMYRFTIQSGLKDYLSLLNLLLNSNNSFLIKRTIIEFIKFFNIQQFFISDEKWVLQIQKKQQNEQEQLQKSRQFTSSVIEEFFKQETQNLLQKFLFLLTTSNELSDEDMIEQEEENDFSQIINPKDVEVFSLALIASELLILRFPQLSSQLLQTYIEQTIQANFQINPNILNSLLIIIGLIPKIQRQVNQVNFSIHQDQIFLFLQQSNDITHKRRLVVLMNRFSSCLIENEVLNSLKQVGQLIQESKDSIIIYQSFMFIKQIVINYNGNLQWTQILVTICPYIVQLLKGFTRTSIVTPLLDLLSKLIEKCSYEQPQTIYQAIENSGLLQLMQSKFQESEQNTLIIEQVCEMLKTLIVAYPQGSQIQHLFQMAITLIQNNVRSSQFCILNLIVFLLQEYQQEQQNYQIELLLNIINSNLDYFSQETSQANQGVILSIFEEFYLLGVRNFNDLKQDIQLLEIRYSQQNTSLKMSVISFSTTILLLMMNQNKNNEIGLFSGLLQMMLNDFMQNHKMDQKLKIEQLLVSFLNRFIIMSKDNFLQYLNYNNISFQNYFIAWMKKCKELTSQKSIKLNIIALLQVLDQVPPDCFVQNISIIALQFKNYLNHQENQNQRKVSHSASERLALHRTSIRKENLRNTQMYNEANLPMLFQQIVQQYVVQYQLQNNQIVVLQLQNIF